MKKQVLITVVLVCAINIANAQTSINPDTVCVGSNEEYKIENPDANSIYTWGIENSSGTIHTTTNSHTIKVEWNNTEGVDNLWVYETNKAGCKGDTYTLKVVRLAAPTAKFKDENLCYGQNLQVIFTGMPPYKIEYTLNGSTKTLDNIKTKQYMLNNKAGNYQLIKVSNKHCVGTIASGGITNATIAEPLKKLKIIRSN